MKKILTHWTLAFITLAVLMAWGLKDPFVKETARLKSFDLIQKYDTPTMSEDVVIVQIDEKSIEKYGQWPWPRHVMAMLHAKIADAGAVLGNYNILFAEPDRMSGVEYLKSFPMSNQLREQLGTVLLDTDAVFSTVLKESGNIDLIINVCCRCYAC